MGEEHQIKVVNALQVLYFPLKRGTVAVPEAFPVSLHWVRFSNTRDHSDKGDADLKQLACLSDGLLTQCVPVQQQVCEAPA